MEQTMDRAVNFLPRVDDGPLSQSEVDGRLVTLTAPASTAAEQYRTLFYRLERLRSLRPMKVTAFTSALPGEGKTVTAVNLALTAARGSLDRRILLIDADLRRSQVGQILGIRARPGLSELLRGECEPRDAIRRFMSTRLAIIPAGEVPEEPTQLLAGGTMRELLVQVRDSFDEVYVDLPPALPFADAAILGNQTDAVVMVIRANVTSFSRVSEALEHLAGAPVVGSVLNGAESSAAPYLKNYVKPRR
jgi:capsular exopolysaccharide synthesis family protein